MKNTLIVSFTDDSPSFSLGFEAGMIWATLEANPDTPMERTTRVENREVIRRMAVAMGYYCEVVPTEAEGWDTTILTPAFTPTQRPNPRGLHVVVTTPKEPHHD